MKKLLLLLTLCTIGTVNAQTEKGSWVVGGSTTVGFNGVTTKTKANGASYDGPKVSSFNFTPSVGHFVADQLAVGLDLGLTSVTTKSDSEASESKVTNSTFSIMPTATYYFKSESKVLPYVGAGVGYGSTKSKANSISLKTDGLAWKAKGGIAYFITDKVAIDLGLSFNQFSNKQDLDNVQYKTKVNTFGVGAGLSIFL